MRKPRPTSARGGMSTPYRTGMRCSDPGLDGGSGLLGEGQAGAAEGHLELDLAAAAGLVLGLLAPGVLAGRAHAHGLELDAELALLLQLGAGILLVGGGDGDLAGGALLGLQEQRGRPGRQPVVADAL